MIFSSKLAKIGKAENISCCQTSVNPLLFDVYISNDIVQLKKLTYQNKKYTLSQPVEKFGYIQMLGINKDFALARNDKYFAIIKVNNES